MVRVPCRQCADKVVEIDFEKKTLFITVPLCSMVGVCFLFRYCESRNKNVKIFGIFNEKKKQKNPRLKENENEKQRKCVVNQFQDLSLFKYFEKYGNVFRSKSSQ